MRRERQSSSKGPGHVNSCAHLAKCAFSDAEITALLHLGKEKTFLPTEKKENCGQLPIFGHRSPYRPMAQSERYHCGNTAIAEMRRVLRPRQPAAPDFADLFSHQTHITPTGASSRATRGRWLRHHPSAENPEEFCVSSFPRVWPATSHLM